MKRRIHYGAGLGIHTPLGAPCGVPLHGVDRVRSTDNRRGVTCKRCRAVLRRWFPRLRRVPLAKRKIHFYSLQYDTPAARCGIRDHRGLITGKMTNITCGRCLRILGLVITLATRNT